MNKIALLRILVACVPLVPVPLLGQQSIATVGTGEYATTYVTATGKVYTTVGNDTAGYSVVAIPGLSNIVQAEGGQYSSVLRGADGKVYSVNGGTTDVTAYPVDNTGATFTADYVQGFYRNFLALKNGELWYWTTPNTGRNSPEDRLNQGYIGTAPKKLIQPPSKTLIKVVSASPPTPGSETFVWALANDGTIWQWDRSRTTPAPVTGFSGTARDIAMVGPFAFVVETTDKQLWTWGYYALYTGGVELWRDSKPRNVTALWEAAGAVFPSKKLEGNYNTLHIIDANNNMFASGCNMQGNVGNGQQHPSWKTYPSPYLWRVLKEEGVIGPVQVPGKWKNVISNNTVAFYLYGQDMAGNWYSWGRNKSRALGNGLTMNSSDEASRSEYYNIPAPRLVTPLTQTWTVSGPVDVTANRAPVASAGINQYLPAGTTSTTLYGIGSHQQQPTASTTVTMSGSWSKTTGGNCQIVSPTAQNTTVSGLFTGSYVFRNTVTNSNAASDYQEVTVVVDAPAPPAPGHGLTATYFDTETLSGTSISRVDGEVNFFWGTGSPDPAIQADTFSARWEGEVEASETGLYTFKVGSDEGTRLWVAGALLIDFWSDHTHSFRTASIALTAGQKYLIKLEYFEKAQTASVELKWIPPSGGEKVIPSSALYLTSPPPPAPGAGRGLRATYYDNVNFTGTSVSRIDPTVDFAWGAGSPAPLIAAETFSARWEGEIEATVSGTYTFGTASDDGSWLWIGNTLVVDNGGNHGNTLREGTIVLNAGQRYPIKVEYFDNTLDASMQLRWKPPGAGNSVIVPSSALYPSAEHGLVGTYFDNMLFTGTSFSRVDPMISFYWDIGSPDPRIGGETFSVRWEGNLQAPVTGVYTFSVGSDDGSRLWVGGTLVADNWGNHGHIIRTGTIALTAGQKYPIKMEYYESTAGASAELKWTRPGVGESEEVVPSSVLFAELPPPPAVRYDFGGNDAPTTEAGWNNVTNVSVGTGVTNSVDTAGNATGIGLSITQAFNGVNSQGSLSGGIYPSNAIRDSVYVNAGVTGRLRLSGLDPTAKYTLTFFASRAATDNTRVAKYLVGSAFVTLDAAQGGGNTSVTAALSGIVPSSSGTIDIDVTNNPGSTFGYLGVLEVQRETPLQVSNITSSLGSAPVLVSAVSRQAHGSAGSFDINLPISGVPGVECRQLAGGSNNVILTFSKPIAGGLVSLRGIGSINGLPLVEGDKMTVSLAGLADGQTVQLNVADADANDGSLAGSASIVFRVLAGDVNGDGVVSDADVDLVKSKLTPTISTANAFADINRNGALNTTDVVLTSSRRGASAL